MIFLFNGIIRCRAKLPFLIPSQVRSSARLNTTCKILRKVKYWPCFHGSCCLAILGSGLLAEFVKVLLKQNFRMWDFYLIIKFEPYLEIMPFFLRIRQAKTSFSAVRSWQVEPKIAAILARPKQRSDVTGCIILMPCWKFRVIKGEETYVQSPRKTSLGHLRAVKQLITVALDLKRWRVDPEAFSVYSIGYFQDILCEQANECKLLNHKTIGTLGQMASSHFS